MVFCSHAHCRGKQNSPVPLKLGELWLPWSNPDGDLMCTPWEYVQKPCLQGGKGLLPWEWHHFHGLHLPNASTTEGYMDDVMIHAVHSATDSQRLDQQGFNLTDFVVEVEAASDLQEEMQVQAQPLVYIDNLVHLNMARWSHTERKVFQQMQMTCLVLNPDEYLSKYTLAGSWRKAEDKNEMQLVHKPARLRQGRLHRKGMLGSQS